MVSRLRACANIVFRTFRRVERWGERMTGKVGPFFVAIAVVLIGGCAFTFFNVIFPITFLSPETSWLYMVFGFLWCSWLVAMFSFHYYMAITTPPGSPLDPISPHLPPSVQKKSLFSLIPIPQAICVGPLARLSRGRRVLRPPTSPPPEPSIPLNPMELARPESSAAFLHDSSPSPSAQDRKRRRHARVCRKCPPYKGWIEVPIESNFAQGSNVHSSENSNIFQKPSPEPAHTEMRQGWKLREKPERTHHCRICGECILKYDHHCPWINQCVGLRNERYFTLFLVYFSMACASVTVWGLDPMLHSMDFSRTWPHQSPRVLLLLTWVLSITMAFAVGIMGIWQLWLIAKAESSVESNDNEYYEKVAKQRGQTFRNPYDLGTMRKNLAYTFNYGLGRYPMSRLFLPMPTPPASNGWQWERRPGWDWSRDGVINEAEELTEGEDEDDV